MKNIYKYFLSILLVFFCFSNLVIQRSYSINVFAKTSDNLLGDFVESAYNIFYERQSDLDGFTYWYEMLGKGKVTARYFVEKFVLESPEFSKKTKIKRDFLDKMYRFVLGRGVDNFSIEYWLDYIDNKILYYYKKDYPQNYTNKEILTLRWDINDSPEVMRDVLNRIMDGGEFAIRVSFMNVKLNDDDILLFNKRSEALKVYNSISRKFVNDDYSEEILDEQRVADGLEEYLYTRQGAYNLKNKILNYLGDNLNNVAVSFYDITTHESFDINGDVLFKAGSTYKVPLNIVLYDLVQAGKINLNDTVIYNHDKHYEGGSGVLKNYIVDGTLPPQKFSELSRRSILNSDNIAANMLITGINQYANLYKEYGKILGYDLGRTGNTFSTNEMNMFLKKIYYNEKNNPYYKKIVEYLKNSSSGVRIRKYIPDNLVASKYGSYQGNYHDIGIVYGDSPFIISIFTRDLKNSESIIANIAKIVYEG